MFPLLWVSNYPSPRLYFNLDLVAQRGHKVTEYLGMIELFETRLDGVQYVEDLLESSQALLTHSRFKRSELWGCFKRSLQSLALLKVEF